MDINSLLNTTEPRTPSSPPTYAKHLNRDQRRDILLLRSIGHTYTSIHRHLGHSIGQIQTACRNAEHPTPKKRKGRPGKLSFEQIDRLESYLCSSKDTRRMPYKALAEACELNATEDTIRRALKKRGYSRRVAPLWTAETRATAGGHRKTWITRKMGESLHSDCIPEKVQRMSVIRCSGVNYSEGMSDNQLRDAVRTAWDMVPPEEFQELVKTMRDRLSGSN